MGYCSRSSAESGGQGRTLRCSTSGGGQRLRGDQPSPAQPAAESTLSSQNSATRVTLLIARSSNSTPLTSLSSLWCHIGDISCSCVHLSSPCRCVIAMLLGSVWPRGSTQRSHEATRRARMGIWGVHTSVSARDINLKYEISEEIGSCIVWELLVAPRRRTLAETDTSYYFI